MAGRTSDDRATDSLPAVVSDSSTLIGLAPIGRLALLADLFEAVLAPTAVVREIARTARLPAWLIERPLTRSIDPRVPESSLGPGETEVIGLAHQLGNRGVILDDRSARRLAEELALPVVGCVGILLQAKRLGRLDAVMPDLDALVTTGFFIAPGLDQQVLADAGEGA